MEELKLVLASVEKLGSLGLWAFISYLVYGLAKLIILASGTAYIARIVFGSIKSTAEKVKKKEIHND